MLKKFESKNLKLICGEVGIFIFYELLAVKELIIRLSVAKINSLKLVIWGCVKSGRNKKNEQKVLNLI